MFTPTTNPFSLLPVRTHKSFIHPLVVRQPSHTVCNVRCTRVLVRELATILSTVCIQFPPLHMPMVRFCLRIVTIHVNVLMLNKHHYHIPFYIDELGSQHLYHGYIQIDSFIGVICHYRSSLNSVFHETICFTYNCQVY